MGDLNIHGGNLPEDRKIIESDEMNVAKILSTFTNENELNSWLEEQFTCAYNEKLIDELEKKGREDLIAKHIDSSRIEFNKSIREEHVYFRAQ